MDSIFKVTFGHEVGTLKPELPDTPFAEAFSVTNEIASSRFMNPFWKLQRVLNVGSEATIAKSAKVVDDFIYGVMEARRGESASPNSVGIFFFLLSSHLSARFKPTF